MELIFMILGGTYLAFGLLLWFVTLPFAAMTTDGGKMGFFIGYLFLGPILSPLWLPICIGSAVGEKIENKRKSC